MISQEAFDVIQDYHSAMGYTAQEMTREEKLLNARNFSLALFMEVSEIVDSFPWKPWRKTEDQTCNIDNLVDEVVDCLFFLNGICEIFEIDYETLANAFENKMSENYNRIARGYSKINKTEGR